jgi:predicted permease
MSSLKRFAGGLKALFRKEQVEKELGEELRSFVEAAASQKMRAGMTPKEALRAARLEMGSAAAIQDKVHESSWESAVDGIWQDVSYGLRIFRKNPGFTALAIITLALGMGASTTVFGWIDSVLLHPLPGIAKPEEVVALENLSPNGQPTTTSYPDFQDYRDHLTLFAGVAVARHSSVSVGEADNAERVFAQFVSGNFFDVLGVKPTLGRFFAQNEQGDKPGAFPLAVISHRLWQSRFNSDPAILGKSIKVNRHELTIIGVTPPEFLGSIPGLTFDIWVPNVMRPLLYGFQTAWQLTDRHNRDMLGIARLRPGIRVEQAQAEIATLAQHLAEIHPDVNQGVGATVLPLWKAHFGAQSRLLAPLQILAAVCLVVLLIVCANVANLLLARFTTRQKEFSMRLALGAKRRRLIRQLVTESLVLALAGAFLGVVVAVWSGRLLHYLLPPGQMFSLALGIQMNRDMLVFTGLLCIATTLLCGLMPAFHSVRMNLSDSLKESGRSATGGTRSQRMRTLLVLSEVSLALVVLVGAGLFVRSFHAAQKIDPGFDPDNVLLSQFYLSSSGYNLEQRMQFCFRLRQRLESQPGIVSVAYSDGVPLGFEPSWWEELQIKGYVPRPSENMLTYRNVVAPGYFRLMRIPLVEGRDFTEHDDDKSANVMIVNESFVKRYMGEGLALGRQVQGWGQWFTVVGIVKDSKYNFLTEASMPYFYVPFRQVYRADMYLAFYIRTQGDPRQAISSLQRVVHETDPNVTIFDALPLSEYIGASLYPQKIAANLLIVLGLLALMLAAIGLYSVMAYSVAQRTHEIGVRMALGAQRSNVLALVLRQAMGLTLTGLFVGGVVALALSRKASAITVGGPVMGGGGRLLGGGATDPLIYAGAALFLCAIALLASSIPAHRATKVDPLIALRYE